MITIDSPTADSENSHNPNKERLTLEKLLFPFRMLVQPHLSYALVKVSSFSQIDINRVNELLTGILRDEFSRALGSRQGKIKAVISDIDETLAPKNQDVLPDNIEHIQKLTRQGIPVWFHSNNSTDARAEHFKDIGAHVVHTPHPKPARRAHVDACTQAGALPWHTIMAGDYFTDRGARQIDMCFAQVQDERLLSHSVRTLIIKAINGVSGVHDKLLSRPVIRPLNASDRLFVTKTRLTKDDKEGGRYQLRNGFYVHDERV